MIIWTAATKKNDYLLFDMANVMVTDANGTVVRNKIPAIQYYDGTTGAYVDLGIVPSVASINDNPFGIGISISVYIVSVLSGYVTAEELSEICFCSYIHRLMPFSLA